MRDLYSELLEFERRTIDYKTFCDRIKKKEIIVLRGKKKAVCVGKGLGTRINSSIGIASYGDYQSEKNKVMAIGRHHTKPDLMMDLSTVKGDSPIYKEIQEIIGCPIGSIPQYICFDNKHGLDENELLETIEQYAENGISFMTFHFIADLELAEKAVKRNVPVISRGGSILLRDSRINCRKENVLIKNIHKIIPILKKHNIVASIGTTFRPSVQADALDEVHRTELKRQKEIAEYLQNCDVCVMMEGIGHIAFSRIPEFKCLLREKKFIPFMPLGPIVSDYANGQDHITNSVGATYLASIGGADIINAITREEHTGGIPTTQSILEGIDAATVAVKIANECRFPRFFQKNQGDRHNCINLSENIGCSRCNNECPFIWNEQQKPSPHIEKRGEI